mmetsp:Transcript_9874/g.32342  ORF Transcript_9874/g.32342 Transcript_9874/m.32342 type:complete len:347 (+) Transcript_9874:658-1698(+)
MPSRSVCVSSGWKTSITRTSLGLEPELNVSCSSEVSMAIASPSLQTRRSSPTRIQQSPSSGAVRHTCTVSIQFMRSLCGLMPVPGFCLAIMIERGPSSGCASLRSAYVSGNVAAIPGTVDPSQRSGTELHPPAYALTAPDACFANAAVCPCSARASSALTTSVPASTVCSHGHSAHSLHCGLQVSPGKYCLLTCWCGARLDRDGGELARQHFANARTLSAPSLGSASSNRRQNSARSESVSAAEVACRPAGAARALDVRPPPKPPPPLSRAPAPAPPIFNRISKTRRKTPPFALLPPARTRATTASLNSTGTLSGIASLSREKNKLVALSRSSARRPSTQPTRSCR